jgi:hypothetical protein
MICINLDRLLMLIKEKNQTKSFFRVSRNKSKDLLIILMHFEFEFIFTNDCYFIYYQKNNIKHSINFLIINENENEDEDYEDKILCVIYEYFKAYGDYLEEDYCKYIKSIFDLLEMNIDIYGNTSNFFQEYPKNDPTFLQV